MAVLDRQLEGADRRCASKNPNAAVPEQCTMRLHTGYHYSSETGNDWPPVYETPSLTALPLEKAAAFVYRCLWCGKPSVKEAWGPGRVTCPRCGRFAPSPAQLATGQDPTPATHGAVGDMYEALTRVAQTRCPDPVVAAELALEAWHTENPELCCYRCEWGVTDCRCQEGPLLAPLKGGEKP